MKSSHAYYIILYPEQACAPQVHIKVNNTVRPEIPFVFYSQTTNPTPMATQGP